MGEIQLWQQDGLGTDERTLQKIVNIYLTDGITSMGSTERLRDYLCRLDSLKVLEMYDYNTDATLEMLRECFGIRKAFDIVNTAAGKVILKAGKDVPSEADKAREINFYKAQLYDFCAKAGKIPQKYKGE